MRIGILGGGQLGRMLALSGYPLGLSFHFYDPDVHCCAREMAPTMHAAFTDQTALKNFAEKVDVITYENENIPVTSIQLLQSLKPVFPCLDAISTTQDRLLEKQCLGKLNIPTTDFLQIDSFHDLQKAADKLSFPFIVKTRRHGYDGKGQIVVHSRDMFNMIDENMLQHGCIAEAFVNYHREFSVIAVRSLTETKYYDLCENTHQSGILIRTENKKEDAALEKVIPYIEKLLNHFGYQGVMTVEFFEDQDHQYLVNEIAPRVHNSGHWTIEGAYTSQFQNHLRAGLNWPLGEVASQQSVIMENILGTLPSINTLFKDKHAFPHVYGKEEKPGRKLGHITYLR